MRRGGIMLLVLAMAFGAGCGSAGAEPPEGELELAVDGRQLEVIWEDNDSVEALKALAGSGGLELTSEPYGGFEQVAALPGAHSARRQADDRTARGHYAVQRQLHRAVLRLKQLELHPARTDQRPG